MGAEPQDFQSATPMGFAESAAHAEAEVDPSQINLFAGDHVDAGSSSSAWSGKSVRDLVRLGDVGLIGRLRDIVGEFRLPAVRPSLIASGLIVAFGLGWTCASIFNSTSDAGLAASDASLAPPAQRTDVSRGKPDTEKQAVRHHHRIAAALRPVSGESNRPKLSVAAASARPNSSGMAQIESALQNVPPQSTQGRTISSGSASNDAGRPLVPVPDTKPTTIPGWTVREVYGETAVIVGPDHVWTVKTGDSVPGLGRIDSIVRWGNRWIVATTAGLISTD
jgi:hypothetical protein